MKQTITITLFLSLTCITPPHVPSESILSHTQTIKYITQPCPPANVAPVLQKPQIDLKSTAIGAAVAVLALGFKFGMFGFIKWFVVSLWKWFRQRKEQVKINIDTNRINKDH